MPTFQSEKAKNEYFLTLVFHKNEENDNDDDDERER